MSCGDRQNPIAGSFAVWVTVTLLTAPTPMARLLAFYRRVRPPGWWGPVRAELGEHAPPTRGFGRAVGLWIVSTVFVYASLFGIGKLLLREPLPAAALLGLALVTGVVLWRNLSRENVEKLFA